LAEKMEEAVGSLTKGGIWKFEPVEFGKLDFSEVPGDESGCDCEECGE